VLKADLASMYRQATGDTEALNRIRLLQQRKPAAKL